MLVSAAMWSEKRCQRIFCDGVSRVVGLGGNVVGSGLAPVDKGMAMGFVDQLWGAVVARIWRVDPAAYDGAIDRVERRHEDIGRHIGELEERVRKQTASIGEIQTKRVENEQQIDEAIELGEDPIALILLEKQAYLETTLGERRQELAELTRASEHARRELRSASERVERLVRAWEAHRAELGNIALRKALLTESEPAEDQWKVPTMHGKTETWISDGLGVDSDRRRAPHEPTEATRARLAERKKIAASRNAGESTVRHP